jgi:hypothetical protein
MADAEAIYEAVTRANMRFVPTKTPEQQSGLNDLLEFRGVRTAGNPQSITESFPRCFGSHRPSALRYQ